jgi:hypothetical protein
MLAIIADRFFRSDRLMIEVIVIFLLRRTNRERSRKRISFRFMVDIPVGSANNALRR